MKRKGTKKKVKIVEESAERKVLESIRLLKTNLGVTTSVVIDSTNLLSPNTTLGPQVTGGGGIRAGAPFRLRSSERDPSRLCQKTNNCK